jgi:hypothetical protein
MKITKEQIKELKSKPYFQNEGFIGQDYLLENLENY